MKLHISSISSGDVCIPQTLPSPPPVVELRGIEKNYRIGEGVIQALHHVSIRIDPGDFWAITGPSGSGKSSLLNIIGCLDRPSHGSYSFCGRNVAHLDDDALSELRLHKIGFVFQGFNLIPRLTVRENIELPLYYLGLPLERRAARIAKLVKEVGLERRLEHQPAELSGGQQQRVAIARALVNHPELLLADEPTGNLDSATGKLIMETLRALNGKGTTIVLVTHDATVASYAGCRLHMKDGSIEYKEENRR